MRRLPALLAAAVLVSLAARSLADELITAEGTTHTCEVLSVDEDGVLARGQMKAGGVIELKVPARLLDAHWYYVRRDAAIGNDAKARVRFALWCVENDMLSRAKIQVRKATEADPKLIEELAAGKYAEIREKIAARILVSAESDIKAGQFEIAREKLGMLLARLSDTEAGEKSRDTMTALESKEAEAEDKRKAAAKQKLDEAERKADEARSELLSGVDGDYKAAREQAVKGLTEDNVGKALDMLEKAVNRGEGALKKLDAIEKEHAADKELIEAARERRTKTLTGLVKILVHRADLYIWRGSLPNAKKELDAARVLVPTDPSIDAAMARVLAADDDDPLERRCLSERRGSGSRFRGGGRGR